MKTIRLTLLGMMMCLVSVALAQTPEPNLKWGKPTDAELNMTTYAPDPDAEAVVLCSQTELRYDLSSGSFKLNTFTKKRIKILKEEGKDHANGGIAYMYNGHRSGQCEILAKLKATAFNMVDGKLVKTKMEGDMVNHEDVTKTLRLTKFTVPQVTVGTVIEVEYEIDSDYFYDIDDWQAQEDIPVMYTSFDVTVPEYFSFNVDERGFHPLERKIEGTNMTIAGGLQCSGTNYRFVGRNLPALRDKKLLYAPLSYGQRVSMELSAIQIPGIMSKYFSTNWNDVDKGLLDDDDFGGRLGKNPLKAEMQEAGVASISDPKERIMAIYRLLKDRVKWNEKYALFAESAGKVLKEGTGSNASINFILINMLKDAGFEAYPAVMRSRDKGFLTITRATAKELNTFVVAIKVGDKYSYLDGSIEDGWLDVLPDHLLVDRARIVSKDKQSEWVNLMGVSESKSRSMVKGELQADGTLQADIQTKNTGLEAASLRHDFRMATDSATFVSELAQELNCEIESLSLTNHHGLGPDVERNMHVIKQYDATGDMIYLNPWVLTLMSENPLTEEKRTLPVEFPYLYTDNLTSVITLPEGYVVEELPQSLMIKSEDGKLSCVIASSADGSMLSSRCQIQVSKLFFSPDEYPFVKSFLEEIYKRLQDVIVIKKVS
ncbi:MAG: DUF3857 domain-containing protein [Muribaculaceae bacterium]|nr:DUF3857 domain-containing protein [Muribaculaceae bacterium]